MKSAALWLALVGLAAWFERAAALERSVCYITNWAQYRSGSVGGTACQWTPKKLDPTLCTHVNYAFAFMNPDYSLKPVEWNDESQLYGETMALKQKNPNLKVLIAVGGWTMNDVRWSSLMLPGVLNRTGMH
jgi:chitinase